MHYCTVRVCVAQHSHIKAISKQIESNRELHPEPSEDRSEHHYVHCAPDYAVEKWLNFNTQTNKLALTVLSFGHTLNLFLWYGLESDHTKRCASRSKGCVRDWTLQLLHVLHVYNPLMRPRLDTLEGSQPER